ncbi:hypothetical protein CVD08_01410 [Acinetobacter seifertii]|nr:hypothetical protein CVD06_02900 [Acinetobacter seifertii]PJG71922.1 hypothetical protein CVD08_01410 [Acinetobacter seifertii]
MKKLFMAFAFTITTSSFAGLPEMMKIYNDPSLAPTTDYCAVTNYNCRAFTALSKHWQSIPKNYRYHGFDIRKQAANGDAYGLNKGYYYRQDRTIELIEGGEVYYDLSSPRKEAIFARGLAVLLYIEDKNGWAKD